jgi:hypothetical protein
LVYLGRANQESEAALRGKEPGCYREDGFEAFYCSQGDYIERAVRKRFGAGVLYIDIRQCKGTGDLAEEGGFLVVRFDQGQGDPGHPQFDGESGKSGTGTYIGNRDRRSYGRLPFLAVKRSSSSAVLCRRESLRRWLLSLGMCCRAVLVRRAGGGCLCRGWLYIRSAGEKMASGEEAFAEVASHNFFRVADRGEIHARVPALEYIDVCRYIAQLAGREDGGLAGVRLAGMNNFFAGHTDDLGRPNQEWGKKSRDAGCVHAMVILWGRRELGKG